MGSPARRGDPDRAAGAERLLAPLRETLVALAAEVEAIPGGWALRTPELESVWSLNHLHFVEPVGFEEALALAERLQSDQGFRHVVVEPEAGADRLEYLFAEAGWHVDREVFMAQPGLPRHDGGGAPDELTEAQMLELMRVWAVEDHPDASDAVLEQLNEFTQAGGWLWGERRFGVVGEDGAPLALTKLRSDGRTAWIEDVYTVPEARHRGHARHLVSRAIVEAAKHDLTMIIADDNDWPKHLYARLGFSPVTYCRAFHLEV